MSENSSGKSSEPVSPAFQRRKAPEPLHKWVQAEIRHYIISNGLGPGDPLKPEAELAREFGVGMSTVREAVKALEATGVLETRRGSGVFVREFSFEPVLEHLPYGLMSGGRLLRDLLELRKALESAMIGEAMAAHRPETIEAMRTTLAAMAASGQATAATDREFHRLLFSDLGNVMLLELLDLFWQMYHRATLAGPGSDPAEVHRRHVAIFDAVVNGDADAARDAIGRHYRGIEERLSD